MRPASAPNPDRRSANRAAEAGYMLLAVVVMVALVLLALAVAAPVVARQLRRDKEVESEHRAEQYVRAIRLYYRRLKTYPPSMDALEKSNNVRFLRQQYTDPLTGKADWRLIHVGEQKTTVKGFFGEPLGGLETTGGGATLGSASSLGTGFGGATTTKSTTSTIGATSGLAAGFAGATIGSTSTTTAPGTAGASGFGSGSGSGFGSGSGGLGQIMGVGSARSGSSTLTPNEQTSYETWEFLYDPRIEQMYAKSNILGGGISSQPASSFGRDATTGLPGAPGATGGTGFGGAGSGGTGFGGSGFGGTGQNGTGFGSSPGAGGASGVTGSTGSNGQPVNPGSNGGNGSPQPNPTTVPPGF